MACSVVRNLDEWVLSTSADRAIRIELKISDFVDAWHAQKIEVPILGNHKHQMYPLVI